VHENVDSPAFNTRQTILNHFCAFLLFQRWFSQKLDLKHLSSKYQVMNEMQSFNAERNFITNAKQKLKNASKIVSQCLKIKFCTKL
jgi:hypothetical protein